MITLQDYDTSDLADFADTILKGCDTNKDGKVSRKVIIVRLAQAQTQVQGRSLGQKGFTKSGLHTTHPPPQKLLGHFWGT